MNWLFIGFLLFVAVLNIAEWVDDKDHKDQPDPDIVIMDGRVYHGSRQEQNPSGKLDVPGWNDVSISTDAKHEDLPGMRKKDDPGR